jgi:pimeloyl-ACP methyl ester carboxylesterase
MARSGHLQSLIPHKPSTPPALTALRTTPFNKIIHIGYSFGSFLSAALLSRYGNLSDATVLTGYIPNAHAANIKLTSFGMELARTNDSVKFADRGSGYIVRGTPSNVHAIFFKAPFDSAALAYAHSIKQPIPVGEYSSVATLPLGPAPNFKGPLLFMEAEFDFPICGGDCKTGWDPKVLKSIYSGASAVDVYVQPEAGHGLTLHRNATGGYGVMMSWLGEHGF